MFEFYMHRGGLIITGHGHPDFYIVKWRSTRGSSIIVFDNEEGSWDIVDISPAKHISMRYDSKVK